LLENRALLLFFAVFGVRRMNAHHTPVFSFSIEKTLTVIDARHAG
jgi:hypothetical protein